MNKKNFFAKILIFLGVLGPSVITTMAGNDGAGVITYSLAGAAFGYAILFTLPILTILYGVTQEMGSRIAIVTGKGLGDVIRERYGVRIAFLIFAIIGIANLGTLITDVAALKTGAEMLGLAPIPFIIITIVFCFWIVTFTKYEKSQKVFLAGMVFYLAYVLSAILGAPHWGEAVKALVIPSKTILSRNFLIASIAVLGTTITPWGQFFVQSYMKDKNVSVNRLGYAKLEAYLGAFLSNFFTFFIIVATAATLFAHHIQMTSGESAALAIKPFAGEFASILFSLGLICAAIVGIIIVSLTSAYAFSEFFGFTGSLDEPYKKGKPFYTNFLLNIVIASLLVMTPWFPLFTVVIYTQALNGILLPIFFYFILRIINNKEIMGKYVNGRLQNIFSIAATIAIVIAAVLAAVTSFIS